MSEEITGIHIDMKGVTGREMRNRGMMGRGDMRGGHNGRLASGAQPLKSFTSIIDEELTGAE